MENKSQNLQIERQARDAKEGKPYHWRDTPISTTRTAEMSAPSALRDRRWWDDLAGETELIGASFREGQSTRIRKREADPVRTYARDAAELAEIFDVDTEAAIADLMPKPAESIERYFSRIAMQADVSRGDTEAHRWFQILRSYASGLHPYSPARTLDVELVRSALEKILESQEADRE